MAKKHKKKKSLLFPPLSLTDKTIYIILMGLSLVLPIFLILMFQYLRQVIAYSSEKVLAFDNGTILNECLAFPFALYLGIGAFILLTCLYGEKKPIFGKKGISYGSPQYIETYPLFSKNRDKRSSEEKRPSRIKARKFGWRLCFSILAILFYIVPFGLFARKTVDTDGNFCIYSVIGTMSKHYDPKDIAETKIECKRKWWVKGAMRRGYYRMVITMKDGTEFVFEDLMLRTDWADPKASRLMSMLQLKEMVSDSNIEFSGKQLLPNMIEDDNLDQNEIDLLYKLFETDGGGVQ